MKYLKYNEKPIQCMYSNWDEWFKDSDHINLKEKEEIRDRLTGRPRKPIWEDDDTESEKSQEKDQNNEHIICFDECDQIKEKNGGLNKNKQSPEISNDSNLGKRKRNTIDREDDKSKLDNSYRG